MQNTIAAGARKATSPLRYAVGMFGTSIPINMFKTYAVFSTLISWGLSQRSSFLLFCFFIPLSTRSTTPFTAFFPTVRAPDGAAAGYG